jgi:hypothetical protein
MPIITGPRGLDCPDFDVLETSGDVELRRYHKARYVVTHSEAESLLAAQIEGTKVCLGRGGGANGWLRAAGLVWGVFGLC